MHLMETIQLRPASTAIVTNAMVFACCMCSLVTNTNKVVITHARLHNQGLLYAVEDFNRCNRIYVIYQHRAIAQV